MERQKVLFLDWDGTLSLGRFWQQLEDPQHTYHHLLPHIENVLFGKNKDLVRAWMVGQLTADDISKQISTVTGVDPKVILDELEISCRSMELIQNNVLDIVDNLRKYYITAIATDNMDTFTRWTVPALQLKHHFDGILNSFDLKTSKRNVDMFFGQFLNGLNIDSKDCIIIDDSEDKNNGMKDYGFRYIKIKRGELITALQELILD